MVMENIDPNKSNHDIAYELFTNDCANTGVEMLSGMLVKSGGGGMLLRRQRHSEDPRGRLWNRELQPSRGTGRYGPMVRNDLHDDLRKPRHRSKRFIIWGKNSGVGERVLGIGGSLRHRNRGRVALVLCEEGSGEKANWICE